MTARTTPRTPALALALALPACALDGPPEELDTAPRSAEVDEPELDERRVMVLNFDPTIVGSQTLSDYYGWSNPKQLIADYRDWIAAHSHIRYTIFDYQRVDDFPIKDDGFDYDTVSYLRCIAKGTCHMPDLVDYAQILADHQICEAFNAGQFDELWIFGGPYFGYWESTLAGPGAFWYNSSPVVGTSCESLLPIMGYNYERSVTQMVHNLGHRTEATMVEVYGSWNNDSLDHNWDRFGLVDHQSILPYSGCGSIHYPPNGVHDYDYDNQAVADSFCDDFLDYPDLSEDPSTELSPVSCATWGCSELGYLGWWFDHLPAAPGLAPDDRLGDWWAYVMDPDLVKVGLSADSVSCSSEYQAGWCARVGDGSFGSCNVGEWATAGVDDGWVELHWNQPVPISRIELHDRACPEQVLAGHVEFDVGADVSFGALPDDGLTPVVLEFAPREVSSVRVVLDDVWTSSPANPNPGIGEIVVR